MTFPGFPGVLSFFQVFQVFQVEWEPWMLYSITLYDQTSVMLYDHLLLHFGDFYFEGKIFQR